MRVVQVIRGRRMRAAVPVVVLALALPLLSATPAAGHHYSDRFGSDIHALVGPVLGFGQNGDLYSCYLNVNSHTPHLPGNRRLIGYSGAVKCDHSDVTLWVQGRLTAPDGNIVISEAPALGPYTVAELHAGGYHFRGSEADLQRAAMSATITLPGNGRWTTVPPQCRGANTAVATCHFAAAPFTFHPDAGEGERDTGMVDCPAGESAAVSPAVAARVASSRRAADTSTTAVAQLFGAATVDQSALMARNRARSMGELGETIRPRFRRGGSGFSGAGGFTSVDAGATAKDGLSFGTSRLRMTADGSGAQAAQARNGIVRYAGAAGGGDLVVRPAVAGAFVSVVGGSGSQSFAVAQPDGLELIALPNGLAALVDPLDPVNARLSLPRIAGEDLDIRDPRDHGAITEAALASAVTTAGVRPLLVFAPVGGGRVEVVGDNVVLHGSTATTGTARAAAAAPATTTMMVADPSDFVDDGDGTEQGTTCHHAGYDEQVPGVSTSRSDSSAAAFPGVKCFGNARSVRGTGHGWMSAVGSLACVDRVSRTLSIRTCIAVKRWGISIFSSYRDFSCPTSPNSAWGRFVGQTHSAHCISGDHKYKTHIHTSVNGRQTNGYQSGNFRIKRCR